MKIENCKAGQKVVAQGKRGIVMFPCKSSYTGKDMIRIWPDSIPPKTSEDKSGYDGENFKPEDVLLV